MRISLAAILFLLSLCLRAETVEVIAFHFPPYVINEGSAKGFLPELLRAAFKELGRDVEFTFHSPKRALAEFYKKDSLILSSLGILRPGEYSMVEMLRIKGGLFSHLPKERVRRVAFLRGIRRAEAAIESKGLKSFPVVSYSAGIKTMLAGRTHGILAVAPSLNYALVNEAPKLYSKVKMLGEPTHFDVGGLLGTKVHSETLKKLSEVLASFKKSGLVERLARKHLERYVGDEGISSFISSSFDLKAKSLKGAGE